MARKKATPAEEPEQIRSEETQDETLSPPGDGIAEVSPPDPELSQAPPNDGPSDALSAEGAAESPGVTSENRAEGNPVDEPSDSAESGPENSSEKSVSGESGEKDVPGTTEEPADAEPRDPAADASDAEPEVQPPVLDLTDAGDDTEIWEDAPPLPLEQAEGAASEEPPEVLSVDLSGPVTPPDSGGATPEDLDRLLEDPEDPDAVPAAVGRAVPVPPAPATDDGQPEKAPEEAPAEAPAEAAPREKSDRQKFFELKFNRLDRNLTPEERQEWNSIYASYRGRSALTGTIIGIDPFSILVRNRRTGEMEKQTMYCAIVVPYRVRIVIPASEMWEADKVRPDFVLQNMVGSVIDFIITKVDREAGFAIGSRRLAARSQRYFFAHRPNLNAVGAKIKCRMLSVGPRRCLVECYGHDIGLTQRELRYTAIPDLRDEYHPGMELDCIVKSYDPDTDEMQISVKETESNPYDGAEQRHPVGARRLAVIAGKYGGGVFCNLPDGTVCMCNYSYQHEDSDFLVGDHVMLIVQRYDVEKQQMYGKILTKW